MIRKIVFCVTLLFFSNSVTSFAQIQDERVQKTLYEGCLETASKEYSSYERTTYCGCIARTVMDEFTIKELNLLEKTIMDMTDDEQLIFAAANDKLWNILSTCAAEIMK